MKIEDLHWLAGYLEGEGTFHAAGTKKPDGMYPTFAIQVTSVDEDVIQRVASLFEREYGPVKNYVYEKSIPGVKQQQYRARVYGEHAINLSLELLPLMGNRRREQIIQAFALCEKVSRIMEGLAISR